MRYQTGHAEVLAEGFAQTASFTIAASGKAFKGLIDGIYSRKIEAPMRELATNAFDAHKAAGSIAPFEVHLPTVFQPTFWIRDFGTGMSHEFMTTRFCTMFDSTKDGLNDADAGITPDDQVGCLGLGRMSFFAYTDAATYTIWQDGEARLYSVFMGADGKPQTALAGIVPSDEPSGVKVEFAVKKKDYEAFTIAAIRVFKGFPVVPTGLPSDVREALAVVPGEMGSFWKSYAKDYLPDGGFWARQGCVLYPIDLVQVDENKVESENDDDDEGEAVTVALSEKYARFKDMAATIVMDFPIGSVEFDLSRERLAYTDHTLRSIRNRWGLFVSDLDATIANEFDNLPTSWERAAAANKPSLKGLGPLFQKNTYFLEASKLSETLFGNFPKKRNMRTTEHAFFSAIQRTKTIYGVQSIYQSQHTSLPKHPNPAEIVLFYRDANAGRYINDRIAQHLDKVDAQWGFLFDARRLTPDVWKSLGRPPIVRVSEIDDLPKEAKVKDGSTGLGGGGVFDRVKIIDRHGYRAPEESEQIDDHLWGFIHRGLHIHLVNEGEFFEGSAMSVSNVMTLNTLSEALGGPTISFINCRSNDKIGRWSDLPTFYDYYDAFAERFPKEVLGRFVKLWNAKQFGASVYANVFSSLSGDERKIRDDLVRLAGRYQHSIAQDFKSLDAELHCIMNEDGLSKLRYDLLRIATDMGMDVLQPTDAKQRLMTPRWERAIKHLNTMKGGDQETRTYCRNLIRKNAQC